MSRKPIRRALLLTLVAGVSLIGFGLATTTYLTSRVSAAHQEIDPSYANGTTVYMIGPHMITNPTPTLLAQAEPLYILAYPVNLGPPANPTSTCTANCPSITLPSGYQPQCNPCFHPGLPPVFAYHDHVLEGASGFGKDGTAGDFKGPWRIIVLLFNPAVAMSPSFQLVTSDAALDTAEAAGASCPSRGVPIPMRWRPASCSSAPSSPRTPSLRSPTPGDGRVGAREQRGSFTSTTAPTTAHDSLIT
jgi:hypothetical protein